MIAVIGGTGFTKKSIFQIKKELQVKTDFGTVLVYEASYKSKNFFFLPRHGSGHVYPPHLIPYKANIKALKELGVSRIIATSAVGSLNEAYNPGSLVLPDQFIDFTKNREHTFSTAGKVYHLDFTQPFCPELAESVLKAAGKLNLNVYSGGTYVVTEGPRFETPAEIKAFKVLGGDLVGMTLVPEVVLARELNMCYLTISVVTNMAAGMKGEKLTATEVEEMMSEKHEQIANLIACALEEIPQKRSCPCSHAFEGAEV